jgi:hypothetical protein
VLTGELASSLDSSIGSSGSEPVCDVIRTRDHLLVYGTFTWMNREARAFLWNWLDFRNQYDPSEIPDRTTSTGVDFLWHELLRAARIADGSFFVVNEQQRGEVDQVFVSADVIAAKCYACQRTGGQTA